MDRRRAILLDGAVNIISHALRNNCVTGGSGFYLLPFCSLKVNAVSERATLRDAHCRIVPRRQTYIRLVAVVYFSRKAGIYGPRVFGLK